jgi:hypothetical protein
LVFKHLLIRLNNSDWHTLGLVRETIGDVSFWFVASPVRIINDVELSSIRVLFISIVLSLFIVGPGAENKDMLVDVQKHVASLEVSLRNFKGPVGKSPSYGAGSQLPRHGYVATTVGPIAIVVISLTVRHRGVQPSLGIRDDVDRVLVPVDRGIF